MDCPLCDIATKPPICKVPGCPVEAVAAERERCAKLVDEFLWQLPLHKDRAANEASDDAAEMVKEQIAAAIRNSNE